MAYSGSPPLRVGSSYPYLYTQHICPSPLVNNPCEELSGMYFAYRYCKYGEV